MADDDLLDQNEIERLLQQAKAEAVSAKPAAPEGPAPTPAAPVHPPVTTGDDGDKLLGQNDIEKLLQEARGTATAEAPRRAPAPTAAPAAVATDEVDVGQRDLDYLFDQAQAALRSIDAGGKDVPAGARQFNFEEFMGGPPSTDSASIDLIRDVELDLKIELGRTQMYIEDVLRLRKGAVVPLDKLAGDPVDIFVNGRLIARGEVLVLNDNFCVRVAELIEGVAAEV